MAENDYADILLLDSNDEDFYRFDMEDVDFVEVNTNYILLFINYGLCHVYI